MTNCILNNNDPSSFITIFEIITIMMKIQILQNITFEGPGYIEKIAEMKGYEMHLTKLFDGEQSLPVTDYDMLVILGGPMNIYEGNEYPWLPAEKKTIEEAIQSDKFVVGICLGAQLIASVLGAEVYKNKEREIGWYPIFKTTPGLGETQLRFLPDKITVFHWHNETFDIPRNAYRVFSSEATENQSFIYEEKVLAMQFHLEMTDKAIENLIYFCEDDIELSTYVMQKEKMLSLYKKYEAANKKILLNLFEFFLG